MSNTVAAIALIIVVSVFLGVMLILTCTFAVESPYDRQYRRELAIHKAHGPGGTCPGIWHDMDMPPEWYWDWIAKNIGQPD